MGVRRTMRRQRKGFQRPRGASLVSTLVLTCFSSAVPPAVLEARSQARAGGGEAVAADGSVTESVNPIRSLVLSSAGSQEVLEVVADRPMVWLAQRQGEQTLVVELPGTFPDPEVEEIATFEGLVAAVLLEADAEPRTRLVVLTRGPALTSLVPRGNRLQIKLSPSPQLATAPATAVAQPPPEGAPATADDEALAAVMSPTADAAAVEIFEVQLGLFAVADNAAGLAADLRRRGYPAYGVEVDNTEGRVFHTVRLGPYATRQQAQRAAAEYHRRESGDSLIRWRSRPPPEE